MTLTNNPLAKGPPQERKLASWLPLAIAVLGILVITASLAWAFWPARPASAGGYNPNDIVYDRPLKAVHEMEPTDPVSIPFLPENGPQPKIYIAETYYDFGSTGPQEVVQREFLIANRGEAPLTISRAYTSCGCTTADFTASVIPPGKVSRMTLTFDAGFHDVSGQTVRRGIIIENNDPANPQAEIWIQASVRANQ